MVLARSLIAILAPLLCAAFPAVALAEGRGHAPWVGTSLDGRRCEGEGTANFGPFDYRLDKGRLPIVERYHFTPKVEQLQGGQNNVSAIPDIRYTLTKFPNHHRALYSAIRFSLGNYRPVLQRQNPAECFLQRAIAYAPQDPVPQMLFGLYLHRLGHPDKALEHYRTAEKLNPNDAMLAYNMGLAFYDLKRLEDAETYAHRAYDAGVSLPGLRRKLQAAGFFQE